MNRRLAAPILTLSLSLLLAGPAVAGPPAAIPEAGPERAERALASFASSWMSKIRKTVGRSNLQSGASGLTYRSYSEQVETELKPTGSATAPYVGVIRYKENLYSCTDHSATNCTLASVTPVTEIFRFQNGRWVY